MLLTFPGSGTTMSQLLLEYATGVYSGSIYPEDELYSIMPGTEFCGRRLSIIKAHIKDIIFKTLPSGKCLNTPLSHSLFLFLKTIIH